MHKKFEFEYEELDSKEALVAEDLALLNAAFQAVETAFAPYSKFKVGAAARLSNGQIILGSNQESASYPVGICAERTLLNSIGSQFPNESIQAMALYPKWCCVRSSIISLWDVQTIFIRFRITLQEPY